MADSLGYRIKNRVLGAPLHTDQLLHERLGRPTALAVFASDNLSSSAYATEEILRVLIPAVGLLAFSLVVPITLAMLGVLFFLVLSYRETIRAYPTAGGAYMVTRDNFGLLPAQVAGVALLTDYVLTVAVSVAAGTDALTSAFPALAAAHVVIAITFVAIIAFGNLRGVRESGKIFAVPTYFFIAIMVVLLGVGVMRALTGGLHPASISGLHGALRPGHVPASRGFLMGASLFVVLHAFASGGAAVTGVEAISNGVTAFRPPEWRNARSTLIVMASLLGTMFLGLSLLATRVHPVPFERGTPTVIAQIGRTVFGGSPLGHVMFYGLQAGTMLILVLAANTSFADFPRLASFHAGDNFMPRQLTKRGHRLVFSNGIIALALASVVLLALTEAKVDRLIPLYAIGVFTSFTMSQAGMAKHHIVYKEPGWRRGLFVNGFGAVLSFVVDVVIAITKFLHGAWVIVVLVPVMVALLVRLNRQYESEAAELEHDAREAAEAPVLRRHVVLVFVEHLDRASARCIQFARSLAPDELRAVHFALDPDRARDLADSWRQLGLTRLPLQLVECTDRRITRSALEVVTEATADGQTEVSVLLPRRRYQRVWHRLLHDRTAEVLAAALGSVPHANVTLVPYQLGGPVGAEPVVAPPAFERFTGPAPSAASSNGLRARSSVRLTGRVHSLRVQPWGGVPTLECVVVNGSNSVSVIFLGRRKVAGIDLGTEMTVEGMVGDHHGRLAILNPIYELQPPPEPASASRAPRGR
jgi:amino acid transporter